MGIFQMAAGNGQSYLESRFEASFHQQAKHKKGVSAALRSPSGTLESTSQKNVTNTHSHSLEAVPVFPKPPLRNAATLKALKALFCPRKQSF